MSREGGLMLGYESLLNELICPYICPPGSFGSLQTPVKKKGPFSQWGLVNLFYDLTNSEFENITYNSEIPKTSLVDPE